MSGSRARPFTWEVNEQGCHLCTSHAPDSQGRPRCGRADGRPGPERVARVVWMETFGPVPTGKVVYLTCAEPRCINPAHLAVGTQADVLRAAARRGRMRHGERHANAVLTDAAVSEMREHPEISDRVFAGQYGVSATLVHRARTGGGWRHVPTPPLRKRPVPDRTPGTLTGPELRAKRHAAGVGFTRLAHYLNVDPSYLSRVETGQRPHYAPFERRYLEIVAALAETTFSAEQEPAV